jgi:hypothetical protein
MGLPIFLSISYLPRIFLLGVSRDTCAKCSCISTFRISSAFTLEMDEPTLEKAETFYC